MLKEALDGNLSSHGKKGFFVILAPMDPSLWKSQLLRLEWRRGYYKIGLDGPKWANGPKNYVNAFGKLGIQLTLAHGIQTWKWVLYG